MTPFEIVLAALEANDCKPKRQGDRVSALCPAHDDTRPSLSLGVGDDERALVHCFADCPTTLVVRALGLEMSDLYVPTATKRQTYLRRSRKAVPPNAQDWIYGITPRFLTESADPMCQKLFDYLDMRQGTRGRPARGDQAIADALGCQARTVRVYAEHLAGAGWVRIHKHVTDTGGHKATEYEVIHNPGRKRFNKNATTPLRRQRARPRSRLAALDLPASKNGQHVARESRDRSREQDAAPRRLAVVRSSRDGPRDVRRDSRGALDIR